MEPKPRTSSSDGVVGERSQAIEAAAEASRGGLGSENAGMSNERGVRNASTECPGFQKKINSAGVWRAQRGGPRGEGKENWFYFQSPPPPLNPGGGEGE